jgi:hypothetical protein
MGFFHLFYVCHSPLNRVLNLILKKVIKVLLDSLRRVVNADTVCLICRPDLYVIMVQVCGGLIDACLNNREVSRLQSKLYIVGSYILPMFGEILSMVDFRDRQF